VTKGSVHSFKVMTFMTVNLRSWRWRQSPCPECRYPRLKQRGNNTHQYRGAQTPKCKAACMTKFGTLASNTCGSSVEDFLHVSFLASRILRWFLHFWETRAPPPQVHDLDTCLRSPIHNFIRCYEYFLLTMHLLRSSNIQMHSVSLVYGSVTRPAVHYFSKKCVAFIFIYSLNLNMDTLKWKKYVPSAHHKLLPQWRLSHSTQMESSTKLLRKPQNSQIVWCSSYQNDAKQ